MRRIKPRENLLRRIFLLALCCAGISAASAQETLTASATVQNGPVSAGETATILYQFINRQDEDLTNIDFSVTLPPGVTLATYAGTPVQIGFTTTGTPSGAPGESTASFTGAELFAGETLEFEIGVTATQTGDYPILSDEVSYNIGMGSFTSGGAFTTLHVTTDDALFGSALETAVNGTEVTFDVYLENLDSDPLTDLSAILDLKSTLGYQNYSFVAPPILVSDPGTFELNPNFDGDRDSELIMDNGSADRPTDTSTLAGGSSAQIRFIIDVVDVTDTGLGIGNFQAQVVTSARATAGLTIDLSDEGTNPNPGSSAGGMGNDDATTFSIGVTPSIGAAMSVRTIRYDSPTGFPVSLELTIENLGESDLTNVSLPLDLNSVFGVGNFNISSARNLRYKVQNGERLSLNTGFNGSTDTEIFGNGSSLSPGERATILIEPTVTNVTDQGFGLGVYQTQFQVSADSITGPEVTDLSDAGVVPDTNGNRNADEPGENDPFEFALLSSLGISTDITSAGQIITLDYYLEAFGDLSFDDISLTENLDGIFGEGTYTLTSVILVDDPGTFSINPTFDGSEETELITSGGSLSASDTAQIRIQLTLNQIVNQGYGIGSYISSAIVSGVQAGGIFFSDITTGGSDPDPNGDDNPSGSGENGGSSIGITPAALVGGALDASVDGSEVTFDLYLENFRGGTANEVGLVFNLDDIFGEGNYTVTAPPSYINDPGTLFLNAAYDGSGETALLLSGSTLAGSDDAQIRLIVDITTPTNEHGLGIGIYQGQFEVSIHDENGFLVNDLSHKGTNPDEYGDGDPTTLLPFLSPPSSEDAPTRFAIGESGLGMAIQSHVDGTEVRYVVTVENLGDRLIDDLSAAWNLFSVYGFGNYSVVEQPFVMEGPADFPVISSFDGTFQQTLFVGGSLESGETVRISFTINVTTVSNQGSGFGIYSTNATVSGYDPALGTLYTDTSDEGIIPDSNGNGSADDAGEDDPTLAIIGEEPNIGLAEEITLDGTEVTFDLFLESFGNVSVSDVSLEKDLDELFGAGNYSIVSAPSFVVDPGTLSLNGSYDGGADGQIIAPGGTLGTGATAQVRLVVNVDTLSNQGLGFAAYSSQALASATSPSGVLIQDLSDSGTDPDPNGNGQPFEAGENDPTEIEFPTPLIGVALDASVDGDLVAFDYTVRNLGDVPLTDVSIPHNLDAVFGAGNYTIVSGPLFPGVFRALQLNTSFDGSSDTELIAGGSIAPAVTERFRVVVRLSDTPDLGMGPGMYTTQVTATANSNIGMVSDTSDDGNDTDMDGNGQADGSGEDDTTAFTVERSRVGAALKATVDGGYVTFDYTITNIGGADLTNVSVPHDFDDIFGEGNYTIDQAPSFPGMSNGLVLNSNFDGTADTELISDGTIPPGASSKFRVVVLLNTLIDSGSGIGVYSTQFTVTADDPIEQFTDLSDDGEVADTNGNEMPDDAGEDDPTVFTVVRSPIGIALTANVSNPLVTFEYTVENLGNQDLTNVSIPHDFDTLFGAGNYTIDQAPFFPGMSNGLTLNAMFDGSMDTELIDGGDVPIGATEVFRVVVRLSDTIDSGSGLGAYSTQVTATANDDINTISDISDSGTDPDPNGNGMPNEAGENDATLFQVDRTYLGVALQSSVDGSLVTFDYTVENLGVETLSDISLIHDLDAAFGFGNYVIEEAPFFPGASFNLMLNGSFNGVGDTQLAAGGTIAAGVIETFRVVVRVTTPINSGMYSTQVIASASDSIGTVTNESVSGTDPDPNGNGNPNDVGEDTETSVTVPSSVGGLIWSDLDRNGIFDGGDEEGFPNVTVFLDNNGNGVLDAGEPSDITDVDGIYLIENLAAGSYNLTVVLTTLPPDMFPTNGSLPHVTSIGTGQFLRGADIGFAVPPLVSLPDLRNGEKRNARSHRFDNVYGGGQSLNARTKRPSFRFFFSVQNDGYYADQILTQGKGISKRKFRVKVQNIGGGNVTGAFLSRGHVANIESGEVSNYTVRIASKIKTRNNRFNARIRSRSIAFPGPRDLNRIKIRFDASRTETDTSIRPPGL